MRPKERRDSGQNDLFNARLDQIVDMDHPLVKLAGTIDWRFLEERFGAVYSDKPDRRNPQNQDTRRRCAWCILWPRSSN
jgi:IS5 family transposase